MNWNSSCDVFFPADPLQHSAVLARNELLL